MLVDLGQGAAKIGKPAGMMPLARALQVVHQCLHAIETSLIEWLQDVEGGKQEVARATGWNPTL